MSNPQSEGVDGVITDDDVELGALAEQHEFYRRTESDAKAKKDEIAKQIAQRLDSLGMTSAVVNGRRLGFTTRHYYGIAEGNDANERNGNINAMHAWLSQIAPDVDVPASANINKAVQAYLDIHGEGAELPPFLSKTEVRSVTNSKA